MLQNKFKDTKGVIRSDNLKKDRQYNDQMKKDKKRQKLSQKHFTEN